MNATNGKAKLRVLVVDDSAVVRQILSQLLERDRRISVVTSPDPVFALQKIAHQRPIRFVPIPPRRGGRGNPMNL